MKGHFVLDDWPNLGPLEQIQNWTDIWVYTFSGVASSVGRPISYFSFALQAEHWPSNPFPFKFASLLIHIANALLCYACCYLLAIYLNFGKKKILVFSLSCSFLWLFSPLHASTVFYVVQRMTLLAGFFTWLGILGFLFGCYLDVRGHLFQGRCLATGSILVAYLLGILSKENAVLLGIFITACYYFIVRIKLESSQHWWDAWVIIFALTPVLIIITYLVWGGRYLDGYIVRDFDVRQRVYSEWRILWEYVSKIIIPTPTKINIFNDDLEFSESLFSPMTTFFSGLMWLLTIALSFCYKKSLPFLAFATLWFLGGHLLESSFIGLELYFEHRNYLPSAGIIIAIVWGFLELWEKAPKSRHKVIGRYGQLALGTVFSGYCLWSMLILSAEAMTWRDQRSFSLAAVSDRPESLRAHQELAAYFLNTGDYYNSFAMQEEIDKHWPNYPGTYAWMLFIQCIAPDVAVPSQDKIMVRFKHGHFEQGVAEAFNQIYKLKNSGGCEQLSWEEYRNGLHVLMTNQNRPHYGVNDNLFRLVIFSYIAEKKFEKAALLFDSRDESDLDLSVLKLKMEVLFLAERNVDVLALIQRVRNRFEDNIKLWAVNGHYFLAVEKNLKSKI
ncbi:MAG: hypothetical protein KUG76_04325 [Gammaproteobacteria bacterium]|nr:hypothetical protein [Gammaproteobacteria bacterium]